MRAGGRVFRGGRGVGGIGLGGLLLLVAIGYFLTGDPTGLLTDMPVSVDAPMAGGSAPTGAPSDEASQFVAFVLADTEDTWGPLFNQLGGRYEPPTLVLFTDAVQSACGFNDAAVGPFYCPGDYKLYIDLGFYRELEQRFGAPGDFAQAYVIAHEVGHHVQNLLGVFDQGAELRQRGADPNEVSIRQELQADCFAGVWGYYAQQRDLLEPGDLEEGLNAAAAIGDDQIQRRTQGRVTPETWTHGSSTQRVTAFRQGFESGQIGNCQAF